uniref:Uncharacterized protein n=1 Tax=Timema poppense TaxID=170557 RepID=A0A7R9GXN3_TIMPO|nr:unnamed protein product [Timema poppensis]
MWAKRWLIERKKFQSYDATSCWYSSPVASLVLSDSSQLTSDSQHLGFTNLSGRMALEIDWAADGKIGVRIPVKCIEKFYSSPMTSLVLTDSSQLTADGFEKLPDQNYVSLRRTK